jgi:hypothetical protein
MRIVAPVTLTVLLLVAATGCRESNDDRLVGMAQEHAARQAEQNRQVAELHKQLAEGSRQLVEADARAREELTVLQHDLRADRAEVGRQRDQLEAERRQIAEQRNCDPLIAAAILHVGLVLACLLPLAFGVYVLWSPRRRGDSDDTLVELLIEEVVADRPPIGLRDSTPPLAPPSALIEAPSEVDQDVGDAANRD